MAYTTLSNDPVKTAMVPIDKIQPVYEKADKETQKQIKKEVEEKAKKVKAALDAEVVKYKANAQERYANIDERLTRALGLIKKGQDGLKNHAKSGAFVDLMPANVLPAALAEILRLEKADDKAYSAAQFAYRQNPAKFDFLDKLVGDKFTAGYREIRKWTIDEGKKHIQPKLTKLRKLEEMAIAIAEQAEAATKIGGASVEDLRKDLLALANEIKTSITAQDRGTFGKDLIDVPKGADSVEETVKNGKPVEIAQSVLDGVLGSIKSAKAAGENLKKRIAMKLDQVSAENAKDKTVATYTKILKAQVADIDKALKELPPHYQRGLKALSEYRKKVEKKK